MNVSVKDKCSIKSSEIKCHLLACNHDKSWESSREQGRQGGRQALYKSRIFFPHKNHHKL